MDKSRVITILSEAFFDNPSVNFVVKPDHKQKKSIQRLMEYSFFQGSKGGKVYLSENKLACAIVIDPNKKKPFFSSIFWDLKLMVGCIGIFRVGKVLKRQKMLKTHYPKTKHVHFWYLGVDPAHQGKGLGSALLNQIIQEYSAQNTAIVLETSNPKNFPLYEQAGFKLVGELTQFAHPLRVYLFENTCIT